MARPQPLAEFIDGCLGSTLAAQGFAASDVVTAWPEIVGERLAAHTEPLRIEWPRGARSIAGERPEPATLVVRVAGAFALELQHSAPIVLERVNMYFGWRCVGRLVLRQGPIRPRGATKPKRATPDAGQAARVRATVAGVADDRLRDALTRLGDAVVSEENVGPTKA